MKTNYQRALAVNGIKRILAGLVLATGVMLTLPLMAAAYPAPVDLKSCSNFAILAYSTVTTTGGGIINGDVGLYPAGSQQIPPSQINGRIYNGGAIAQQAQNDLTAAYLDAAGRNVNRTTIAGNIGGQTLVPGLYWSDSSLQITGDLTLNAGGDSNAVWIFQMGSTLTTAAGAADAPHSQVILTGGAQAKNIFWQVGSSATLGTYSIFKGTIMAQASVTMGNYSIMDGRALARTGAVTFNGNSGSLPDKWSQVITNFMPINGSVFAGTSVVGLSAQASPSGLPVSFTVKSGPGTIIGGTNLAFASTGLVRIVASQAGNASYFLAPSLTNTFTVIPPLSTVPGWLEIQVTPSSGSWQLTAPAGYTGATTGTGNLAPVSAVVGEYRIAYGALSGYMTPTNHNQAQFVVSGVTSLYVGVYRPVSADLAPPVVTATKGTYTNKVQISWQSVPGVVSYEIWKSQANDVNTAVRIVEVPDYGTEIFQYDDDDVVPVSSYYYWGLSKTATQVSPMSSVATGYAKLSPIGRAINDYDGDGKSDLAVYRDGYWSIYLMAGRLLCYEEGLFGGPDSIPMTGDYDGDGKSDLAFYRDGYWSIYLMAGRLLCYEEGPFGGPDWTPVSGDFDGDGKSDLAVYRDGYWSIYLMAGRLLCYEEGLWGGPGWTPVSGDFDGDGKSDLAVYRDGYWSIYLMAGSQLCYEEGPFGGAGWTTVSGDFDGDGKSDLAVYRDGYWSIYLMAGSLLCYEEGPFGGVDWTTVQGDFDGDGKTDLAVYRNGYWSIYLMAGSLLCYEEGLFGGPDSIPVQ
ncbi:MAG: ice-binding family protein [Kiritimatiellaeota bacterium]|nr:ice-binding family protein [Kiritimatiellota bacterium]